MNEVWTMDRYRSVGASLLNIYWRVSARPSPRNASYTCGRLALRGACRCSAREPKYQSLFRSKPWSSGRDFGWLFYPRAASIGGARCGFRPADPGEKLRICRGSERDGNVYRSTHGFRTSVDFTLRTSGPTRTPRQNIRAYWFRQPTEQIKIEEGEESLLLWMRFPDMRFMDTHAASAALFDSIWDMLETVWMRTVQKVPAARPVLVTSDHGYIFLGQV